MEGGGVIHFLIQQCALMLYLNEGGPTKKPELSSGEWAACSTGFPHWVSVLEPICIIVPPGIVVRGSIWPQGTFLEDSFSAFAHLMMGDLRAHLPTRR